MQSDDIDIAILGGGLAGGMIALALAKLRPEVSVLLIEQGEAFGGNHVWSYFASDVAADDNWLVDPLVAGAWPGYDVRFPALNRTLTTPYFSITSVRLDAALRTALPTQALLTGATVISATATSITLADQQTIRAGGVIDARGATALPHMAGGWQKFLGQMIRLEQPHGLTRPIVMDATVEQRDGYRFVYCLPFSADTIFVEDTYYADSPALNRELLRDSIASYCRSQGWVIADVLGEEQGVLPVIAKGDFTAFWHEGAGEGGSGIARAGVRAAMFHPLTSYSLPDALRFARKIAALPDLSGAALAKASYDEARALWRRGRFYRMLSTMLFGAAEPLTRYRVLQRFYRLPKRLIERFYAGRSSLSDKARILIGKPPVPMLSAMASLMGRGKALAPLYKTKLGKTESGKTK
jgi:lycopene beta-cyclase